MQLACPTPEPSSMIEMIGTINKHELQEYSIWRRGHCKYYKIERNRTLANSGQDSSLKHLK